MLWLEQKYIGLVSSKLSKFKRRDRSLYNFRCPVCGDSQTNPNKARGYVYEKKGSLVYHCHNCGITMGLPKLVEFLDKGLYQEYVREKLMAKTGVNKPPKSDYDKFVEKMKTPKFIKKSPLRQLKKISQLRADHPAKRYVVSRKIPNEHHARLFYCEKFKHFVNEVLPGKFESTERDEARIIIPFIDEDERLVGFTGRSLNDKSLRYITIMLVEDGPKIYGLDTVDLSKPYLIVEGAFDAMFLQNAIAMCGGSIDWAYVNENAVFVYDNEPRSPQTVRKIEHAIDRGHCISLFDQNTSEKDVNSMVMAGKKAVDISTYLYNNRLCGLSARLELMKWKKT